MAELLEFGVDVLISDRPDLQRELLAGRELWGPARPSRLRP